MCTANYHTSAEKYYSERGGSPLHQATNYYSTANIYSIERSKGAIEETEEANKNNLKKLLDQEGI